jgi:hypothetical protein
MKASAIAQIPNEILGGQFFIVNNTLKQPKRTQESVGERNAQGHFLVFGSFHSLADYFAKGRF